MEDIGEEITVNKLSPPLSPNSPSVSPHFSIFVENSPLGFEGDEEAATAAYLMACAELFTADAMEFKIVPSRHSAALLSKDCPSTYLEASFKTKGGELTTVLVSLFSNYLVVSLLNYQLVLPSRALLPLTELINELNAQAPLGKFLVKPKGEQLYLSYHVSLQYCQTSSVSAITTHLQHNYSLGVAYYERTAEAVLRPFLKRFQPSKELSLLAQDTRQVLTQLDLKNFNEKHNESDVEFMFGISDLIKDRDIPIVIVVSADCLKVVILHHSSASDLSPDLKDCIQNYLAVVNTKLHAKLLLNDHGQIYLEHTVRLSTVRNIKDCIQTLLKNNLRCYISYTKGLSRLAAEWRKGHRVFDYEALMTADKVSV
jgi:hypothetical protein